MLVLYVDIHTMHGTHNIKRGTYFWYQLCILNSSFIELLVTYQVLIVFDYVVISALMWVVFHNTENYSVLMILNIINGNIDGMSCN
jgi:hypothetical protein